MIRSNILRTRTLIASVVAVFMLFGAGLVVPISVRAQNATTTTNAATTGVAVENKQEEQALQSRLKERVASLKTKLTTAQEQRIKARCEKAQGVVSSASAKIDTIQSKRTEVYGGVVARLSQLSTTLGRQGLDTAKLSEQITSLRAKITTYETDLRTYDQAVTDLKDMDCTSDPAAFQASLDAARASLVKVRTDAAAVRAYAKDTIRPTLQDLRSQLQASVAKKAGEN